MHFRNGKRTNQMQYALRPLLSQHSQELCTSSFHPLTSPNSSPQSYDLLSTIEGIVCCSTQIVLTILPSLATTFFFFVGSNMSMSKYMVRRDGHALLKGHGYDLAFKVPQ